MQILIMLMLGLLAWAVPGAEALAAESTISPTGKNAWDFYVFGNGQVVYSILMGLKMLMMPDAGSTGFTTLLLFMATLGFLVLAVGAGFNPSKGFVPLFGYILVVWLVAWMATKVGTNLNIIDMVPNESGGITVRSISDVPAIVGLPAAMTSQIGVYLTESLETYMSTPSQYHMGKGAGQFNLFANMVDETTKVSFSNGNLKMTISSYIADCVIPAIAMGRLHYKGDGIELYGAEALMRTPDLMATLKTAKHNAILTRTYDIEVSKDIGGANRTITKAPDATTANNTSSAMGSVKPCAQAYDEMEAYAIAHTSEIMNKGSTAFAQSGVFTPYEDAFKSMIAQAASGGGGTVSSRGTYGNANGMVLQSAMINQMAGSFRDAALQTGNNEIMMAANITQAEQNQKTSWAIGFATFNNMMGYVFTVLQAFIYAITPMIVIALMIPGMGKSIFVNYAQILIWLTLWQPMLSVINFVVTLFAMESIQTVTSSTGGLTVASKGILTERASNSILAAQFLGTMTPMITWGIVKGAMAFTEFISAGVGTQFANAAASNAAAGNFTGNTVGMNNVSMGNFNTAMSSSVGAQPVSAFTNAGAMLMQQNGGGTQATANNVAVQNSQQFAQSAMTSLTSAATRASQIAESFSDGNNVANSISENYSKATAQQQSTMRSEIQSAVQSWAKQHNLTDTQTSAVTNAAMEAVTGSASSKVGGGVSAGGSWGVLGGLLGNVEVKAGASAEIGRTAADVSSTGGSHAKQLAAATSTNHGEAGSKAVQTATTDLHSALSSLQNNQSTALASLQSAVASAQLMTSFQEVSANAQSTASVISNTVGGPSTLNDYAKVQASVGAHMGATQVAHAGVLPNIGDTPTATDGANVRTRAEGAVNDPGLARMHPSHHDSSVPSAAAPAGSAAAQDSAINDVAAGRERIAAAGVVIGDTVAANQGTSILKVGLDVADSAATVDNASAAMRGK